MIAEQKEPGCTDQAPGQLGADGFPTEHHGNRPRNQRDRERRHHGDQQAGDAWRQASGREIAQGNEHDRTEGNARVDVEVFGAGPHDQQDAEEPGSDRQVAAPADGLAQKPGGGQRNGERCCLDDRRHVCQLHVKERGQKQRGRADLAHHPQPDDFAVAGCRQLAERTGPPGQRGDQYGGDQTADQDRLEQRNLTCDRFDQCVIADKAHRRGAHPERALGIVRQVHAGSTGAGAPKAASMICPASSITSSR